MGGTPPLLGRRPLLRLDLRGPAPLSLAPIYMWGVGGHPYLSPWRLPPSRDTSSSPVGALAKPCVGRTSSLSPRRRADGTRPQSFAGSEPEDRHRAERVLNSEVPYVRCLDRSDREDVRLHQPRCANASAYGLRGYVDNTLPSRCYAITMILRVRRIFF